MSTGCLNKSNRLTPARVSTTWAIMQQPRVVRLENITTVTLDAGGTLMYPHPSVGAIYAEVMFRHGLDLAPERLETAFRKSWKSVQRSQNGEVSEDSERGFWRKLVRTTICGLGEPDDFNALFDDLWESFGAAERWRLHDGAIELIDTLAERNLNVAILSNWDHRLRHILEGMQLVARFDAIVISSEVGIEKPHTGIFRRAEKALAATPDAILHVGDSLVHDIHGAWRAGWQALLVTHGASEIDAVPCFPDLAAVRKLLTE